MKIEFLAVDNDCVTGIVAALRNLKKEADYRIALFVLGCGTN